MADPPAEAGTKRHTPKHLVFGGFRIAAVEKWSQSDPTDHLPTLSTPHERLVAYGLAAVFVACAAWAVFGAVERIVRTDDASVERDAAGVVQVVARLPPEQAQRLTVGMTGAVRSAGHPSPVPVVVSAIEEHADPTTGHATIRLEFMDAFPPGEAVRAGDSVSVRIPSGAVTPTEALLGSLLY